jgi:hypothetical protein
MKPANRTESHTHYQASIYDYIEDSVNIHSASIVSKSNNVTYKSEAELHRRFCPEYDGRRFRIAVDKDHLSEDLPFRRGLTWDSETIDSVYQRCLKEYPDCVIVLESAYPSSRHCKSAATASSAL